MKIKGLVVFLLGVACVSAYPMGAPQNICGRIIPGHRNMGTPVGNGPRTGPFTVQAEPSGNGMYKVTLRATTALPFKGFLIQAIPSMGQVPNSPNDVVGMFQQDFARQTQTRRCNNRFGSNALTHTFNDTKTMVEGTWQAPPGLRAPGVKFVATVVQDYDNFYVVHSNPVQVSEDTPTQTPPLGPPASATGFSRRPFGDFQGNFQGPSPTRPTQPTGFPSLNPSINTSGARRSNGTFGGGISVISNEQVTSSVTMTPTPDFIGSFSVTDSPPPPIILPDGRVSSHNANRLTNNLQTNPQTTVPPISPNPTLGSFSSSSIRRGPEIRLASPGSNISPSASSIPVPSSDPLSQVGLTEVSFRSLFSSNSSIPSSNINRVAMRQIVSNRTRIAPTISSSNGITFLSFPTTPAPTAQPRTRSSFTTVSSETIRSVRRPIQPTLPVMIGNRTIPQSLLTFTSRLSETNVNPPRSSASSNISPLSSVSSSAQGQASTGIDTIVIPVDTQNEQSLFEPLNFADIRAPAPTLIENIEGIPVGIPVDTSVVTNTTNIVVNATIGSVDTPRVQIINLPLLPEGQRAAVIDVVDTRPPETSRIVSELSGSSQRGTSRIIRPNGAIGQGQVPGMTQPGLNQGFPGQQLGNRFGPQTPFGRPGFGGAGSRIQFGQQFRPGQGQMFGRPGQFNGFGSQSQPGLQGLNLPGGNIGTFGSQGQGLTPDQTVQGGQGGQQTGLQPGLTDGFGSQIGSGNIFGGQFGTPVTQQGSFGPTGQFGQGFPGGRRPFAPPGFPTGGRIQFSGMGPQGSGQFGPFGRPIGGTRPFGTPFGAQDQFGGQGQFGSQGQFGGQFGAGQFGGVRGGSSFFGGRQAGAQFGRNAFGMNQFNGGRAPNQPNTFAPIPPFGVAQGQGQGQTLGGQGTLTLGGQPGNGLNGQSSGNLFNQLSQPNDNSLNNLNAGTGSNSLTPSGDQNQGTGSTGGSGLSSFAFGPFSSNTK